jgi:hypothetical protein
LTSCADVDQAALDALVPGLEPTDEDAVQGVAELACAWEAPAGAGSVLVQLYTFAGSVYYYEDEVSDAVAVDLCDRAFRTSEIVGTTAVFQSGETVVQVSLAEILVPDELEIPDEEEIARVEAFAGTLAEGIC